MSVSESPLPALLSEFQNGEYRSSLTNPPPPHQSSSPPWLPRLPPPPTRLSSLTRTVGSSRPSQVPNPPGMLFCTLCCGNVARGSKHCRACDKCVLHFDHHCKWLNNCVGSKNYQSFFLLVITILFQVLAQMVAGAFLLWWAVTKSDVADEVLESDRFSQSLHRDSFVAALAVYLVAGAGLCYLVGELFFFHLILIRRGITTYDYILGQRDASKAADGGSGAAKGGGCCGGCGGARGKVAPAGRGGGGGRKKVSISCWALLFAATPPKRQPSPEVSGGGGSGGGGDGDVSGGGGGGTVDKAGDIEAGGCERRVQTTHSSKSSDFKPRDKYVFIIVLFHVCISRLH